MACRSLGFMGRRSDICAGATSEAKPLENKDRVAAECVALALAIVAEVQRILPKDEAP